MMLGCMRRRGGTIQNINYILKKKSHIYNQAYTKKKKYIHSSRAEWMEKNKVLTGGATSQKYRSSEHGNYSLNHGKWYCVLTFYSAIEHPTCRHTTAVTVGKNVMNPTYCCYGRN